MRNIHYFQIASRIHALALIRQHKVCRSKDKEVRAMHGRTLRVLYYSTALLLKTHNRHRRIDTQLAPLLKLLVQNLPVPALYPLCGATVEEWDNFAPTITCA